MITELKITNFRSLREVWLDNLQPVNLLIGPNNSGKSNILKALKFFSEFLEEKIPERDQLQPLFYQLTQESNPIEADPISIQFVTILPDKKLPLGFGGMAVSHFKNGSDIPSFAAVYSKSNDAPKHIELSISNVDLLDKQFEEFEVVYHNYPIINSTTNNITSVSGGHGYLGTKYLKQNSSLSKITTLPNPALSYLKTDVSLPIFTPFHSLKIFRLEPSKLLELYPIQNERSVHEDAGNLVAFLQTMRNEYEGIYNTIKEDLQRFVPEFKSINFKVVDNPPRELQEKYINKSLAKIGLTDKFGRIFWADSLSEGTLYFLSLLCIIHQPEPPKLLLLEEPEKGIHPRRIRETMDLIFELAAEKNIQVILTTHSTAVVDTFADIPEAVYIVERVAQQTIVKNLQRDVIETHKAQFEAAGEEPIRFTDALGEHWAMGFLGGVPE